MLRKKKQEEYSPQEIEAGASTSAQPKGNFFKKHWKLILLIVIVLAAAVFFLLPRKNKQPAQTQACYVEESPEARDITNTYSTSGTIAAADTYTVKPLVKGTVLTADFEVGDTVEKGDVLYTIDSSDAETNIETAQLQVDQAQRSYDEAVDAQYVRTDIAGTVSTMSVKVGDVVQQGQTIATIRDESTMLLTLSFPAADAANFSIGQSAQVILDNTFEAVSGSVQSISGTDTLSSGNMLVRTVTIAVSNPGSLTTAQAAAAIINGVSSLESARFTYWREQTITSSSNGTVAALCVHEGDHISAEGALIQLSGSSLTKQIQSASDSLRSAKLQLENAEDALEDYTITAPISGTIIQKGVKAGDTVGTSTSTTETMCIINDLSYLEMTLNVDELEILSIEVGQDVEITADAIDNVTFKGVVTNVSTNGTTTGGTTTYPVTVRLDDTGDLLPGMNATAEIITASASGSLSVPNAAIVRGSYILVTSDSPSASNAVSDMTAPDGYVYVQVTTGVSDDDYIAVTSGLTAEDTIAYDADAASRTTTTDDFQMGGFDMGGGAPGGGSPGGGF